MAQNVVEVLYLTNSFRKFISLSLKKPNDWFLLFLDNIHRAEHLVPYYHCFQAQNVQPKVCSAPSGIINILGIPTLGKSTLKSVGQRVKKMLYNNMDITIHLKNKNFLGEHDLNIANFEAVFSLENQSPFRS